MLVLTRNLPPMVGGMERLAWHILDELRCDYELHAIGPRGSAREAPAGVEVSEVKHSPLCLFLLTIMFRGLFSTLKLRPKVILAGSGLTAPFAWLASRLVGAKAIVYLHGLDIEATNILYRVVWVPFIRRCDKVIVNSHFTRQLAERSGIDTERISMLRPGVALPDMSALEAANLRFRKRYCLNGRAVMLYVGRITERKGLAAFVECSLPDILTSIPEGVLIVIGGEANKAILKTGSVVKRISCSLAEMGLEDSVYFLGERAHDDPEIADAYFAADVHVFPVVERAGDNEGFGMVAIEAAAHGLPTVGFNAGGVADAINDGQSGRLIPPGDYPAFSVAVSSFLENRGASQLGFASRNWAANFTWESFGASLRQLVGETISKPGESV